jgi:hypothetical protein
MNLRDKAGKAPWHLRILRSLLIGATLLLGADNFLLPHLSARGLTTGEVAMLTPVFKDSVDYSKVRIHHSKPGNLSLFFKRAPADTRGNTIIESNGTPDYSAKGLPFYTRYQFVHEMTHVWQNQNHVSDSFTRAARRRLAHLSLRDDQMDTYGYSLEGARDLTDYTIEQQASVVTDYNCVAAYGVPSPLNTDSFASGAERKSAYQAVLKNFLSNPSYPRRK